ncbi:hypothetical protein FEE95_17605 [Maribacter algarum]|uniref:Periplasmic heavy metal sensor n=1 Tax=Maribacter algarum (ex Zhang et al. 2020) TaxID=2578118 RepID=A0A5S3PHH0_9FLAO|nr:hypothetical protein [Maribacter algarum]TMM53714.1 hypothetical protein FEE95_17605 [Maribacter algarum]
MKNNLLLYILLGFLVLVNSFFLFKHFSAGDNDERGRGPRPGNFIAKQLEFDDSQTQKFEKLDMEHRENINMLLADIRELKDSLFDRLSDETVDDSEINAIASQIANKEKTKELETFRFFKAVGELCNDNQKELLKSIIKDALGRQGPPGRNGPPRRSPGEEGRPPPPRH